MRTKLATLQEILEEQLYEIYEEEGRIEDIYGLDDWIEEKTQEHLQYISDLLIELTTEKK
jgi:hypothetical protein